MTAARNQTRYRDELILALDLYLRLSKKVADDPHPDVVALGELLNKRGLPITGTGRRRAGSRSQTAGRTTLGRFLLTRVELKGGIDVY